VAAISHKIEMAAGKVWEMLMMTRKTRRKSKGKKPCEYIGEFVWLLYIALVLCLIGLGGAKAENFGEWVPRTTRRQFHGHPVL
jgi:hypothetical protein